MSRAPRYDATTHNTHKTAVQSTSLKSPFKDSNEERRSISFNADIDENIYNVYGQ